MIRRRTTALLVLAVLVATRADVWSWICCTFGGHWPGGVIPWVYNTTNIPTGFDIPATSTAIQAAAQTWNDDRGSDLHWTFGGIANVAILTGADGIAQSGGPALVPDDDQRIPVGQGLPRTVAIHTGPNGIADTAPAADDDPIIMQGKGAPNMPCVVGAPLKTVPAGDDARRVFPGGAGMIDSGADGICNTAAAAGDFQVVPVNQGFPNQPSINTGANGIRDTPDPLAADDGPVLAVGHGQPNAVAIAPGPNGAIQTPVARGDVLQDNPACFRVDGVSTVGWAPLGIVRSTLASTYAVRGPALGGVATIKETDTCLNSSPWICVRDGGNGILSATGGDDEPALLRGGGVDTRIVLSGANGICETTAGGDDSQTVPAGTAIWTTTLPVPPASLDLQSIVLHEMGHGHGQQHPDLSGVPLRPPNAQRPFNAYTKTVMYFQIDVGIAKRTLLCDDKAGANYLYPPPGVVVEARDYARQSSGGCDFGDASDPWFATVGRYPSLENGEDANANGVLDADRGRGTPFGTIWDFDWNADGIKNDENVDDDPALAPGNGARHKDARMEWLGPLGAAAGTTLPGGGEAAPTLAPKNTVRPAPTVSSITCGPNLRADTATTVTDRAVRPPGRRCLDGGSHGEPCDANGDCKGGGQCVTGICTGGTQARQPCDPFTDGLVGACRPAGGFCIFGLSCRTGAMLGLPCEDDTDCGPTDICGNCAAADDLVVDPGPDAVLQAVARGDDGLVTTTLRSGVVPPAVGAMSRPASTTFEPETRGRNRDELDDGVSLRGPLLPGVSVLVDLLVDTSGLAAGRYDPLEAAKRLFVNGWEDWNGDGDWKDWAAPIAGGLVGGAPPCVAPPPTGDEYVLHWQGSPTTDAFFSPNFCGGTAVGATGRVLTFKITAPPTGFPLPGPQPPGKLAFSPLFQRFRLDYAEDVGQNLTDFSDPTLVIDRPGERRAVTPADMALGIGFDQGEAKYGEVEDYVYCYFVARLKFRMKNLFRLLGGVAAVSDPGGRLLLGNDVVAEDGTWLVADRIRLGNDSSVSGVAVNELRQGRDVAVRGAVQAAPPLPLFDPFAAPPTPACGGPDVEVDGGTAVTIAPGAYGDIRIRNDGTLRLMPGTYELCSFTAGRRTQTIFEGPEPSAFAVAGRLKVGAASTFGPATGPAPFVTVAGSKVAFGASATVDASLAAPGARLTLGRGMTFSGSFAAKVVGSDHSVTCACLAPR